MLVYVIINNLDLTIYIEKLRIRGYKSYEDFHVVLYNQQSLIGPF